MEKSNDHPVNIQLHATQFQDNLLKTQHMLYMRFSSFQFGGLLVQFYSFYCIKEQFIKKNLLKQKMSNAKKERKWKITQVTFTRQNCKNKTRKMRSISNVVMKLQLRTYNKYHIREEYANEETISQSSQPEVLAFTLLCILVCHGSTPTTLENRRPRRNQKPQPTTPTNHVIVLIV